MSLFLLLLLAPAIVQSYQIRWHQQQIDNFGYEGQVTTYQMRYIYDDSHFDGKGPILMYTGNEGDIFSFYNNTGFMTKYLAPKYNALLLFPQHRYFGESMPFGKHSFDKDNLRYLTVEQALADYATFISDLKAKDKNLADKPVYVFGGSYGGMLSSWMRMKYPHLVHGAIAASAPIRYFRNASDEDGFFKIITEDFESVDHRCSDLIHSGFQTLLEHRNNVTSYKQLSERFQTCEQIEKVEDVDALINLLNSGLAYMAMTDYPSPASFLEPMPAWPINVACKRITDGIENAEKFGLYSMPEQIFGEFQKVHTLQLFKNAMDVYFNYTGQIPCYDLKSDGSGSLDAKGWNYLACTDVPMPMGSNGKTDMFYPQPWNYEAYTKSCQDQYGVTPRYDWALQNFGGLNPKVDFQAHSNIVFSNGKKDPWMAGGVLQSVNDSVIALIIQDGAHHLDLRTPRDDDPESVKKARAIEVKYLEMWMKQYDTLINGGQASRY